MVRLGNQVPVPQIMLSICLCLCRRGAADDDMGSSLKTPDDARIAQLTVEKLVVRLNSVLNLEENLPQMEKMVQERWADMSTGSYLACFKLEVCTQACCSDCARVQTLCCLLFIQVFWLHVSVYDCNLFALLLGIKVCFCLTKQDQSGVSCKLYMQVTNALVLSNIVDTHHPLAGMRVLHRAGYACKL